MKKRVKRTKNSAFERAFRGRFAAEKIARNIQFSEKKLQLSEETGMGGKDEYLDEKNSKTDGK